MSNQRLKEHSVRKNSGNFCGGGGYYNTYTQEHTFTKQVEN